MPFPKQYKTALLCSGGAMKAGAFHMGVALALESQFFTFSPTRLGSTNNQLIQVLIGSSAGSLIATYLAAGYSPEDILTSYLGDEVAAFFVKEGVVWRESSRRFKKINYPQLFFFQRAQLREFQKSVTQFFKALKAGAWLELLAMKWLRWSGFFSTQGIEKHLREEVLQTNHFQDYESDLFIVATPLDGIKKVVFSRYELSPDHSCGYELNAQATVSEACAASASLPVLFSPYPHVQKKTDPSTTQTRYYTDGDIRDVLSIDVALDQGVKRLILSYIHVPYEEEERLGSLADKGVPRILIQTIYQMIHQKIENQLMTVARVRALFEELSAYCLRQGLTEDQRLSLLNCVEQIFHLSPEVEVIPICPEAQDQALFLEDPFHLSPEQLLKMALCGYRAAQKALKAAFGHS